jgi:hypothetical protein
MQSWPVIALTTAIAAAPAAAGAQTAADPILSGYQQFHRGDKTGALQQFAAILSQKPDDLAARFAHLAARYKRIQPADEPAFTRDIDALIGLAEARRSKTGQDTEATFYLAQAHMLRAEYRFDRNKGMWGAARDGARAKGYIDDYVKRHPEHDDAYYVLGLYNYYVDIAPAFAKVLRLFLFLPAGDRKNGLKQLERCAEKGTLFGPEASLILAEIYARYENRPEDALAVAERLQKQYPDNDDAAFAVAETYSSPALEQYDRAGDVYQAVANRHAGDTTADGLNTRYRATQALAGQRFEMWRVDDAIAALTPAIDAAVRAPDWVLPQFLLRRANYRALLDDPKAADDVARVLNEYKTENWQKAALDLQKWMQDRKASGQAARYAALIPAHRLTAERKWDEARRAYLAEQQKDPQSFQIRYGLAYLDFSSGRSEESMGAFSALTADKGAPPNIRANALLYVARAHDLAGRRAVAIKTYEAVTDSYEKTRAGQLARVGLVTPYKRPKA